MSLKNEKSLYLLQHLDDPVNWYPWKDEVLTLAEEERKPIFLSIGYSSCHWCHVMQKEVFRNKELAKLLNDNFISIKVDREERPDIDKYFQSVYQLLNRTAGGWPTSIFLTHTRKPFYAGTYIPPQTWNNRIGFGDLITIILEKYQSEFDAILESGDSIETALNSHTKTQYMSKLSFTKSTFTNKFKEHISSTFEKQFGGFSKAPKFPHTSNIDILLDLYSLTQDKDFLNMSSFTLIQMAKGGFYDLIDGGFCRYSVDSRWNIPHFEKMLYDNSLLAENYLKAYFLTEKNFFKNIALETLDFLIERMSKNNLFWSASDADTDGVEGKYFVYKYDEVRQAFKESNLNLLENELNELLQPLDVKQEGNFETLNIVRNEYLLNFENWDEIKEVFKKIRQKRKYPNIDKKIITSWNAMAIKSLFIASKIDKKYLELADNSLKQLLEIMFDEDNNLIYHSTIGDEKPEISGFLEDYAYLSDAIFEAYLITKNSDYLILTEKILKMSEEKFFNKETNKWHFSELKNEFSTEDDIFDNTYPSSSAVLNSVMIKIGSLTNVDYLFKAKAFIQSHSLELSKYPSFTATLSKIYLQELYSIKILKTSEDNLESLRKISDFKHFPFLIIEINNSLNKVLLCNSTECKFVLETQEEFSKIDKYLAEL